LSNKALRILIADEQHFHRMKVERLFNHLGYYRIAPVNSLEELLTLVDYGSEPFDAVVINASLGGEALDLLEFLRDHPQVHHALIYHGQQARLPIRVEQNVEVSHGALPDLPSIQRLIAIIDPGLPFVGTVISVR